MINRRGFFGTLAAGALAKLLPWTDKVEAAAEPPRPAETSGYCRTIGNHWEPCTTVTTTTFSFNGTGSYTIWMSG